MLAKRFLSLGVLTVAGVLFLEAPSEGLAAPSSSMPAGNRSAAEASSPYTRPGLAPGVPVPGRGSCSLLAPCEDMYVRCMFRYDPQAQERSLLERIRLLKEEIAAIVRISVKSPTLPVAVQNSNLRRVSELQAQIEKLVREAEDLAQSRGPARDECNKLWSACCESATS